MSSCCLWLEMHIIGTPEIFGIIHVKSQSTVTMMKQSNCAECTLRTEYSSLYVPLCMPRNKSNPVFLALPIPLTTSVPMFPFQSLQLYNGCSWHTDSPSLTASNPAWLV